MAGGIRSRDGRRWALRSGPAGRSKRREPCCDLDQQDAADSQAIGAGLSRSRQLDAVHGAIEAEGGVAAHEGGYIPGPDNALEVRRRLSQHGRNDPHDCAKLRLDGVAHPTTLLLADPDTLLSLLLGGRFLRIIDVIPL